jgi:N-acetylmuramic acid 6-phosphate etherase
MAEEQTAAAAAVQAQTAEIAAAADAAAKRLRESEGRLVYVGAGTSGRIAIQDGVELVPTFGWDKERLVYALAGGMDALLSSVEGAEDDPGAGEEAIRAAATSPDDVVIGVAASGRTAYTVAAVRAAAAAGALTIGIANNPQTPLLEAAAHPIFLDSGSEVVAGSTRMKAGTAQKIALNLFSTALMLRLGRVYRSYMVSMRISNRKLRARASAMVSAISDVDVAVAEKALELAADDIKLAVLIALGAEPAEGDAALRSAAGDLRKAVASLSVARPRPGSGNTVEPK